MKVDLIFSLFALLASANGLVSSLGVDPRYNCYNNRNADDYCNVNKNQCHSADPKIITYMHENCAHTCGFCLEQKCFDIVIGCEGLKNLCFDKNEGEWVTQICPRTCGMCGAKPKPQPTPTPTPTIPEGLCYDRDTNCNQLAYACDEPRYRQWMSKNCALTCKRCKVGPPFCADANDLCPLWAEHGFCEDQEFPLQKRICAKTYYPIYPMTMAVRYGVAVIDLTIFALVLPLNTSFLWIICRTKSLWKLWAYKIMFLIGVVDTLLLITTLEAGLMSLLNVQFPHALVSSATVLSLIMPVVQGLLSIVLAYNRFVVILGITRINIRLLYYILLLLVVIVTALMIGFFCYFIDYYLYNLQNHGFHTTWPATVPVLEAMNIISIVCFVAASIMYSVSFGSILLKRRLVKTQEVSLLLQAFLPFVWLITMRVFNKIADSIKGQHSDAFTILLNLVMRSLPASHAVVYLVCNRLAMVDGKA
ncbi:hypothetical protein QR680_010231 [Steinernema hermaphroditum]|uniref:ShKT domain-containing protein n=1 Tax=Steinernema hermaphroditum TaxID=289476 RepID=A0AA39IPN4_9BILA|nr:hypothetical protein QR680_010231 [Steinernema hermaphroditum]